MKENMELKVVMDEGITAPTYAHEGDAGMDLRATADVVLPAHGRKLVHFGCHVQIPYGYVGLLFSRSGHGVHHGIRLANSVGVIDAGFRGELMDVLVNDGDEPFEIKRNDRVAQLVIMPYATCNIVQVDKLDESVRGEAGYGSSGVK